MERYPHRPDPVARKLQFLKAFEPGNLVTLQGFLIDIIQRGRLDRFFKLVRMLLRQRADVNAVCHVIESGNAHATRSALTIMLRLKDRLLRVCDEEEVSVDEERSYDGGVHDNLRESIEAALENIITTMKQHGAEERGSSKFNASQGAAAMPGSATRTLRDTVTDIPAPPYEMDLGPNKYYGGTDPAQQYSRSSTQEPSSNGPSIRGRLGKIRRFALFRSASRVSR